MSKGKIEWGNKGRRVKGAAKTPGSLTCIISSLRRSNAASCFASSLSASALAFSLQHHLHEARAVFTTRLSILTPSTQCCYKAAAMRGMGGRASESMFQSVQKAGLHVLAGPCFRMRQQAQQDAHL